MNRASTLRAGAGLIASLAFVVAPEVAHACPMCFSGNNSNQSAFLYGSLFLMIVPVTAIGSLLYWAYRRTKALEAAPPPPPTAPEAQEAGSGEAQARPALRLVRR